MMLALVGTLLLVPTQLWSLRQNKQKFGFASNNPNRRGTVDDPTRTRAKLKRLILVSLAVHVAIIASLLALFSRYRVSWPSRAGVVLPAIPLLLVVVLLLFLRAAQRKAAASK